MFALVCISQFRYIKRFYPPRFRLNTSQCTRPSGTTFGLVFNHRYVSGQSEDQSAGLTCAGSWTGRWETSGTMVLTGLLPEPAYKPTTGPL